MDENWNPSEVKVNGVMAQGFLSESHLQDLVIIKNEPLTDTYTMEARPFARGKFATVRRCRHKASGQDFAAKIIRKRRRAADVRHEILHEVCVLKLTNCKNRIVRLHEVFETPTEVILVLELVSGGELQRVIDDEVSMAESDVIRLMRQILEGLSHLHERNIAHLDIKPQNILLTSSFPHCDVKLCDFGISRVISKGIEIREIVGTPDYVAPEILQYEPIGLATDMWSVGILAYVLLSGHTPFGGETKQETFCNITDGHLEFPNDIFDGVSNDAKDFIRRLLVRDPSERMTVKDCLKHTWLSRNNLSSTDRNSSSVSSLIITNNTPDDNIQPNSNSNHSQRPTITGDKYNNQNDNQTNQNQASLVNPSDLYIKENPTNHAAVQQPEVALTVASTPTREVGIMTNDECTTEEITSSPSQPSNQIKEEDNRRVLVHHELVPQEALVEETEKDTAIPLSRVENLPEERALVLVNNITDEIEPANKRAIHILPDLKLRRERSITPTPQGKELTNHGSLHQQHHHHHQCSVATSMTSSNNLVERQSMKTKSEMVEFDGLTLSKRIIFSEEILVDERMGMVY